MRQRIAALVAVLALGLVPAFAAAGEVVTPTEPTSPTLLAKAYGTVASVAPDAVTLDVDDAYEWVDGAETKTPAPAIVGQRITMGVTDTSIVRLGEKPARVDALKVGMKIKAVMRTDVQPAALTNTFTLLEAYVDVPKVHPADKYEFGFFHRLFHVRGVILGTERVEDRNVMNLDVRALENAPKRFRDEGIRLSSMDAYVIVPARVVITDVDGDRIAFEDLDVDDRVKVVTKALPKAQWMTDEAGEPTPTLIAKRVKVKARG